MKDPDIEVAKRKEFAQRISSDTSDTIDFLEEVSLNKKNKEYKLIYIYTDNLQFYFNYQAPNS